MLWKEDLKSYFTFHNKDMAATVCLLAVGFSFKHSVMVHTVSVTKHFSISTVYVCDISANQMFDCCSVCLSWYPGLNLLFYVALPQSVFLHVCIPVFQLQRQTNHKGKGDSIWFTTCGQNRDTLSYNNWIWIENYTNMSWLQRLFRNVHFWKYICKRQQLGHDVWWQPVDDDSVPPFPSVCLSVWQASPAPYCSLLFLPSHGTDDPRFTHSDKGRGLRNAPCNVPLHLWKLW